MTGVRFAPSPTGVLHLGNLRTAWISWHLARTLGTPWVVRFEDIDRPRVVTGAMAGQLADLEALGMRPDLTLVQSEFFERHWLTFEQAALEGRVYPCYCSRKEVKAALEGAASAPHGKTPHYSGSCRVKDGSRGSRGKAPPEAAKLRVAGPIAWRFKMPNESGADDFIAARALPPAREGWVPVRDGYAPSYNWACAVDDLDGDYRLIVRATDLAQVLEEQREIQRSLIEGEGRGRIPAVFHCALVTQDSGERLEKRTRGVTLAELKERGVAPGALVTAFERGFTPPQALAAQLAPEQILAEARESLRVSEVLA